MSHWTCQFDVSHLISSYPRVNKFNSALFTKFLICSFLSDHLIISTSTNSAFPLANRIKTFICEHFHQGSIPNSMESAIVPSIEPGTLEKESPLKWEKAQHNREGSSPRWEASPAQLKRKVTEVEKSPAQSGRKLTKMESKPGTPEKKSPLK